MKLIASLLATAFLCSLSARASDIGQYVRTYNRYLEATTIDELLQVVIQTFESDDEIFPFFSDNQTWSLDHENLIFSNPNHNFFEPFPVWQVWGWEDEFTGDYAWGLLQAQMGKINGNEQSIWGETGWAAVGMSTEEEWESNEDGFPAGYLLNGTLYWREEEFPPGKSNADRPFLGNKYLTEWGHFAPY